MVLYGISLVPLAEELWASDPGILYPFFADDAVLYGLERCRAQLFKLLLDRGPEMWYFPDPYKLLFIAVSPDKEEALKWEFEEESLQLNFVSGSSYLGDYLRPREYLEAWVQTQL